jgi:hypothetical protein
MAAICSRVRASSNQPFGMAMEAAISGRLSYSTEIKAKLEWTSPSWKGPSGRRT